MKRKPLLILASSILLFSCGDNIISSSENNSIGSSENEDTFSSNETSSSSSEEISSSDTNHSDSSSQDTSSIEAKYLVNIKSGNHFLIELEKNEYAFEENVSFKVKENEIYPNYLLDDVEVFTSTNSKLSLTKENDTYSFLMPKEDVEIRLSETILYEVFIFCSNMSISLSKNYYKLNEKVEFTYVLDEGYELESLTYSYIDQNENEASFSCKNEEEGKASFIMPSSNVTIKGETKEKQVVSNDPWTSKTTYKVVDFNPEGNADYHLRVTLTFNGDSTLTYLVEAEEFDEWEYDFGGYMKYLPNGNDDSTISYTYDETSKKVNFIAPNHSGNPVTNTLAVAFDIDNNPISLTFETDMDHDILGSTKGAILTLVK